MMAVFLYLGKYLRLLVPWEFRALNMQSSLGRRMAAEIEMHILFRS